jgi:ribonucleoside-diphosphate reductase alpha subunit
MRVLKRSGSYEDVSFDKILNRIKALSLGNEFNYQLTIDPSVIAQKVCSEIYDGVKTTELDELSSEIAISLYSSNLDYSVLAARIVVSNHHKNTVNTFSDKVDLLHNAMNKDQPTPLVNDDFYNYVMANAHDINDTIDYTRDYDFDFFGLKTLEKSYLYKVNGEIIERPQDMIMRVALSIHRTDLDKAFETYDLMSKQYFTHATPTLYNAGSNREQYASCFLLAMKEDSIKGIYNTLSDCATISQHAGGIGLHIHNVRATNSFIAGTNGKSNGIVPMLRVYNDTARYVDQCVTPETFIYTTDGPKQIQDCVMGKTSIYTTNGTEIIQNVLEHEYTGELLEICTMHSVDPLRITPEHPVYCIRNQPSGLNYNVIKNRLDKELLEFEWTEAKHLTTNDLCLFKIPDYEMDTDTLSQDDCYMYGLILGDGCLSHKGSCYLSLHSESKKDVLSWAETYLEDQCIKHYTRDDDERLCVRLYWNRSTVLPFRHADIYDDHKEKRIATTWLHLPIHKAKYIIKGLLDTDGSKGKELVFDSTSRSLIEGLRYLLLRMGIPTSGYIRDRRGETHTSKYGDVIENKKLAYTLRIPKTEALCELLSVEAGTFHKFFVYGDYIATRVKSIHTTQFEGILYDLQMEHTHNYMIHNGIVHNGGGKRNGSFAIYLEPWHGDIFEFLELKKNHGNELERARDLFYALWIPDLFMKRVKSNGKWSLMCPNESPGLSDVHSDEFEALYEHYESNGQFTRQVNARDLWNAILTSQIETGTPYLLYKDACNQKSNQQNLGTIKSSNLCTEIIQYSDKEETSVCNLASVSLKKFLVPKDLTGVTLRIYSKPNCIYCTLAKNLCSQLSVPYEEHDYRSITLSQEGPQGVSFPQIYDTTDKQFIHIGGFAELEAFVRPTFDHGTLKDVVKVMTRNLNNIIDYNYYPTPETKTSNTKHRPIGLGVQGLANVFFEMKVPFTSDVAKQVNEEIFETIYYGALEASMELAMEDGPYSSYEGSPVSKGILQFDMWSESCSGSGSSRYDWLKLKNEIMTHGVRNSLLVAPMPTASTAQILGNYECFEPIISNIYTRRVLAGEYMVLNNYLVKDLQLAGLWHKDMKNKIIANDGSIMNIDGVPALFKERYKTVWEMSQKDIIDMSAARGKYICQSQSLNLFMAAPDTGKLTSMHFYAWQKGLKTGLYYLRTRPSSKALQFTVKPEECEACSG